jgi:hypothetical protein
MSTYKIITLIQFCVIVSIYSCSLFAEDIIITPKKLLEILQNPGKDLKSQKSAIDSFKQGGHPLNEKSFYQLLDYLKNAKEDLISPLLEVMCSVTFPVDGKKVEDVMMPILNKNIETNNVGNISYLLWCLRTLCSKDTSQNNQYWRTRYSHTEFSLLEKSNALLMFYLKTNPGTLDFDDLDYSKIYEFYLDKLNDGDVEFKLLLLKFYESCDIAYYIRKKHIGVLFALLDSPNKELSEKSSELLRKTLLLDSRTSIKKWWGKNKDTYNLLDRALNTLGDISADETRRQFAASQIAMNSLYYKDVFKDEYWTLFQRIIEDAAEPHNIRFFVYSKMLQVHDFIEQNKALSNSIASLTKKMINDARYHSLIFTWIPSDLISSPYFYSEAIRIMEDEQMNTLSRGFAAYALGKVSTEKKRTAKYLLAFLADEFRKDNNHRKRHLNLTVMGLAMLIGKDHGLDLSAWQKAVSEMPDDPPEEEKKK